MPNVGVNAAVVVVVVNAAEATSAMMPGSARLAAVTAVTAATVPVPMLLVTVPLTGCVPNAPPSTWTGSAWLPTGSLLATRIFCRP